MLAPQVMATTVRPRLFSEPERENGRAAWLLGASFISEGAIPFAAADPFRVIPSMMAGGAVTGGLIMAFDVTLKAPHGGIFVFFAIGHLLWFLAALVAGVAFFCRQNDQRGVAQVWTDQGLCAGGRQFREIFGHGYEGGGSRPMSSDLALDLG